MLEEAVQGLNINPDGVYVDVTFGGGSHSRAILDRLSKSGRLFAFDQDIEAIKNNIIDRRFKLIKGNFSHLKQHLKFYRISSVSGILADFGVSSYQFDTGERGFSTRFDGPLDMRMNKEGIIDAAHVLNHYSEDQLIRILSDYGELRNSPWLTDQIIEARKVKKFSRTQQLVNLFSPVIPKHTMHKVMAQIFQAIRIEVNEELDVIKAFLIQTAEILSIKGRLVCISYHSLEDRLVKRFIREGKFEGTAEVDFYGNRTLPLKKVGKLKTPTKEEIKENNRARSGKLRIAEKI